MMFLFFFAGMSASAGCAVCCCVAAADPTMQYIVVKRLPLPDLSSLLTHVLPLLLLLLLQGTPGGDMGGERDTFALV
jgi:hypothetical protein